MRRGRLATPCCAVAASDGGSRGSLSWPDPLPAWGSVRLRPFSVGDLALVEELSSDPYVPLIGTIPSPFTQAEGLAYIERQHQRLTDGTGWSYAVVEVGTDLAVGTAGLWLHADGPPSAGYSIAPSARGRGLASAALQALTGFAESLAEVDRVELLIEPWNAGSIRVAERCGYRLEGLVPEHLEIGGVRRDMLLYVIDVR
jgi:ribosomal-protein-alanine N-acetyltransferase